MFIILSERGDRTVEHLEDIERLQGEVCARVNLERSPAEKVLALIQIHVDTVNRKP